MPESELVSVLIATRNRTDLLRKCLESLLSLDYQAFEVVVVDQSPTPALTVTDPRIRIIHSRTVGKAVALNIALAEARGRYFAFTDDDCTVFPNWITKGLARFRSCADAGLIFGALVSAPHDQEHGIIPTFVPPSYEVHRGVGAIQVRAGAGANMFASRALFQKIKGFDAMLGPGATFRSCEEFDLYYRTVVAGFAVIRDPDNPVVHWGIRSKSDGSGERLIRDYWFGEGAVLGKHARARDRRALQLGLQTFSTEAKWALMSLARFRGKTNLRRAASWAHGFVKGATMPLDDSHRFFEQ